MDLLTRTLRRFRYFSSLKTVFLLGIVISLFLPTSLISYINLLSTQEALQTEMQQDEQRLTRIMAIGLIQPLLDRDFDATQNFIKTVMQDNRLLSVRLASHYIPSKHILELKKPNVSAYRQFTIEHPIHAQQQFLGYLTIIFDRQSIHTELREAAKRSALMLGSQLCFSIIILIFILYRYIFPPIKRLTQQAKALGEGKLDEKILWSRQDEIGQLGQHLENARIALENLFQQLQNKTDALRQDLEERTKTEKALKQSEARYRNLFLSNLDGIIICSVEGAIIDANPAFLALLSYSEANLKKHNYWDLVAPEHKTLEQSNLKNKILKQGFCNEFETSYLNQFNEAIPVSVKSVAIHNHVGRITKIWRMVRDISEKRLAEERSQLATKVFDSAIEGIMITDADERICSVNKAFTHITGYSEHEALGKNPRLLSSGRHDKLFFRQVWLSISDTGSWQGEMWNRRKNGEDYPSWLTISTVRNHIGKITNYIAIFDDLTERKAAAERIHFLAQFDSLTGLPNRLQMQNQIEQSIQEAKKEQVHLAIMLIDLDHFKTVNESLGHQSGDELLKIVTQKIRNELNHNQILARQGGDEFIILLPNIQRATEAVQVADRIRKSLSSPFDLHNHTVTITPSIGISLYPENGENYETLIRNADAAMYQAKSMGRNNYKFYTDDLNANARETLELEGQLRSAIKNNEFVLHYQAQVDSQEGKIVGAEALIRWQHPTLGLLAPGRFIGLAEERGFIAQIGHWVMQEAACQLAIWQKKGLPTLTMSFNLSALQFYQNDLTQQIAEVLDRYQLPGYLLDVEVTESMLMHDVESTIQTIINIKKMGLSVSIDDFGTGYSSLSYLKRFKADHLKIDRSFIQDVAIDREDAALVRAMISMAKNLNMSIVAEGVETLEQWDFLAQEKCDIIQGYLIAKPVPADVFEALLEKKILLPNRPEPPKQQ